MTQAEPADGRQAVGRQAVLEIHAPTGHNIATFDEAKLDHYGDSEVVLLVENSPHLTTTRVEATRALSPNLLAKFVHGKACYDEVLALDFARKLGIPAPTMRRLVVVDAEEDDYIIIMDRIHGHTLEQMWAGIGWWGTFRIALQLRRYLRAMHVVTSQRAGGLSSGSVCSAWFQGLYAPAPHSSPMAFTGYLNWWLVNCRSDHVKARPDLLLEPLHDHVFLHQDLAPRNMILDARNQLWIVDWGYAGFYPRYMEYAAIEASAMPWLSTPSWSARLAKLRWSFFRWVAMGTAVPYIKPLKALAEVHRRSCIYRLERSPYSETA